MNPDEMPVEPDEPEHEPEPDLNVPHDVWRLISPTGHEGGLLCPSCLCRRLHNSGLKNVPVHFGSGPCAHTDFRASNAELLKALRAILKLHEAHHNDPLHAQAREIIAKAEGNGE